MLGLELVVELLADALAQLGVAAALASRPGASRLSSGSSSVALRRSLSTASATPGYCTLTTTVSPSSVVARCTWPIEAAANARSSNVGEHAAERPAELLAQQLLELRERHRRDVVAQLRELCLKFVALAPRAAPSNSIIESSCPTFIAAPRIWPSCVDELADERGGPLAASRPRPARASAPVGGAHPRPARACPATSPPTRAVRAIRPVGGRLGSAGMASRLRGRRCALGRTPAFGYRRRG